MSLTWKRTWPDKGGDYTAGDPAHPLMFARIIFHANGTHPEGEPWSWGVSDEWSVATGWASGKQEAADAARAAWINYRKSISR